MSTHDKGGSVLDAQQRHWEGMLGTRAEMFGREPSEPAQYAADLFERHGARRVLELGGGQGRDSLLLAARAFNVHVLDYAQAGVEAIQAKAQDAGLVDRIAVAQRDVRQRLPFDDASFDACFSHMLFCMAFTESELLCLSREVLRVLRPGRLCVFTVRNTMDPDYRCGIHQGEDLYENSGFIVHFFDRSKVERVAQGYEIVTICEFTEWKLLRRLYRATLRKPG